MLDTKHGANHQHATHRGCALLHTLEFGKSVDFRRSSNRLFNFQCPELCDNEVSKRKGQQKSGDRRGYGSKSDVKKNIEPDEPPAQVMEVVHHEEMTKVECRIPNCSITSSVRAARLPLISTRSPGLAIWPNNSAAALFDCADVNFVQAGRARAVRAISSAALADGNQLIDAKHGRGFAYFSVAALRFATEFAHFAQDCDAFSLGIELDECSQRCFHRIGIGVVAVVEKMHAADFLDLQARFGERRRSKTGGGFLDGQPKFPTGSDGEQCILHHMQTGNG